MTEVGGQDRPRATFVVTCRNYGRFLAQALDSLLGQSVQQLEAIVIDDASTDSTPAVLQPYLEDPRVRVVRHRARAGHIASYNEGLALARGEAVGILSADDYLLGEDAVARQMAVFEADPEVGLVYSAHAIVRDGGLVRRVCPWPADGVHEGLEEFQRLMWGNDILHSGALLRREVALELGPYDSRLPHTGDWDMWLRAAARHRVGYIAAPLYAYRLHGGNMFHRAMPPSYQTDQVLWTIDKAFSSLPPDAPLDLLAARPAVERHALLQTPWFDLGNGRRRRTWQGVIYALRCSPAILFSAELCRFLPRLLLMTLLGREGYRRISRRWDRPRGAGPAAVHTTS